MYTRPSSNARRRTAVGETWLRACSRSSRCCGTCSPNWYRSSGLRSVSGGGARRPWAGWDGGGPRPAPAPPTPVISEVPHALPQIVGVPRDGGVLHPAADRAALHPVGERDRMTERPADHVALAHADQLVDQQTVTDLREEATAQL